MRAYAHGFAFVEHYDLLGVAYRAYALCDYHHRGVLRFIGERMPESGIRLEVESGEAVVKDIQLRLFYKRAGNRESLFLSARKVGSALRNKGVQSFG